MKSLLSVLSNVGPNNTVERDGRKSSARPSPSALGALRMRALRYLILLLAPVAVPVWSQTQPIDIAVGRTGYVDEASNDVTGSTFPARVEVSFPLIQGSDVGITTTPPILIRTVVVGDTLRLDLSSVVGIAEGLAREPTEAFLMGGLNVEPSNVRIARLATVVHNLETHTVLGFMGFRELDKKRGVYVMYFDRPCTINGSRTSTRYGDAEYHVRISKPGFYWLLVEVRANGKYFVHNDESPGDIEVFFQRQSP